jgi:hypothetical protein
MGSKKDIGPVFHIGIIGVGIQIRLGELRNVLF